MLSPVYAITLVLYIVLTKCISAESVDDEDGMGLLAHVEIAMADSVQKVTFD